VKKVDTWHSLAAHIVVMRAGAKARHPTISPEKASLCTLAYNIL